MRLPGSRGAGGRRSGCDAARCSDGEGRANKWVRSVTSDFRQMGLIIKDICSARGTELGSFCSFSDALMTPFAISVPNSMTSLKDSTPEIRKCVWTKR